MINPEFLNKAINFNDYLQLTRNIIEQAQPNPPYDNEKMKAYTAQNLERMERLNNNIVLDQKLYNLLSSITQKWVWVIITEPWCGDAAQIVPALSAFASVNDNIECKILLRDEHPELMNIYHTNGSKSIPKLICIDAERNIELGTWGPRPREIQIIVDQFKDDHSLTFGQKVRHIHQWYDENKTRAIQSEFVDLLQVWKGL